MGNSCIDLTSIAFRPLHTHTLHRNLAHAYVRTYIPTIINQMWPQKHPLHVFTGTSNYPSDVLQGIEAAS